MYDVGYEESVFVLRLNSFQLAGQTPNYPRFIAGLVITSVIDLTTGYADPPSIEPKLPLSSGHMIQFRASREGDLNVTLTLR